MAENRQAPLFTAQTAFTEESVQRFTTMQFNLFQKKRKYLAALAAFVLIVAGLLLGINTWQGILPLLIGCVIATNLYAAPKHAAGQIVAGFHGKLPTVRFRFYPEAMEVSTSEVPVHYGALSRLEDDKEYLYLFLTPETGYMVRKSSVAGEGGYGSLAALLEERSGRSIHRYRSLAGATLKSLLADFRSARNR